MPSDIGDTTEYAAMAVQLQGLVLETRDMVEFLDDFASFSAAKLSVDGEVFCGITLARRKKYDTVGSSGPRALALRPLISALVRGRWRRLVRAS